VQLLTQAATSSGTEGSAKTTQSPPQEKSATQDDESGSDSVAMALAMVSQSLAQAASAAAPSTAAAGGNVSAAKSDTAQIPAALAAAARVASAAAAAGTAAGGVAPGGSGASGAGAPGAGAGSVADSDDADGPEGGQAADSAATAQKLFALLTGGDSGLGTQASKDATQSGDGSQSNAQGNSDNGPTVNSSTANAHLSVGSHFSVQHGTNEAKATVDVKSHVGSTAWADELGGKITWMARQGIESASLRLSPAHLGPVEVRISVQDGGASVWFGAAQADTRAALEQALPRLREMFSTQGLTLADANVSREPPRQQQQPTGVQGVASVTGVTEDSSPAQSLSIRLGLLDTYA
jgi:flagellar hook-length control protein FliK